MMEIKQSGNTILTRWYSGDSFIKETAGGVTKDYTFIGGDAYTAPVVAITQSGTTTYYNLLRDHLGSITHVVNASNSTLLYEYSYDSWGRMRNVTSWTNYAPGSEPSLFVAARGFTGHEHLPWFNLINMNGRVYDPIVGQFLSTDNHVQAPYYTQGLNRYVYCLNNPLKYTDEDGESFILVAALIGAWIGMGNAMVNSDKQGWGLVGDMGKGFVIGGIAGALGAGVGSGVSSALATGGSFWGGVMGTSTVVSTGFASGLVSGAAGGFTGGFVYGFGNTAINSGNDFNDMLNTGWNYGWRGALFGGVVGGIAGGIDAVTHECDFLTGESLPRDPVVLKIEDGAVNVNAERTVGDKTYKRYQTKLRKNSSVTMSDDNKVTIKIPDRHVRVNSIRQYGDNVIQDWSFEKHLLTITPTNTTGTVILHGFRLHQVPAPRISSFWDLFHYRPR